MHRFFARRGLVIASAVALFAATACQGSNNTATNNGNGNGGDTTGVTATSILLGVHTPLTGTAAASYGKIAQATKAYFAYINSKGGVNGRTINLEIMDDAYTPTQTVAVVNKMILQDKVFAIVNGLGTPTHSAVLDIIKENNVPDLFVASGSKLWNDPKNHPTTFGYQTSYVVEWKILGNYIKTNFPGKKVCSFTQDDDFGGDSLEGLKIGYGDTVAQAKYAVGATSFVAQATQLKAAGCEVMALATLTAYTGLFIATAAGIDWHPQIVVTGAGGDYTTMVNGAALKTHPELANGLISSGYGPLVQMADDKWVQGFKKINDQFNSGNPFDGQALYGLGVGFVTVQALLKGGKNLTRESLVAGIEKGNFIGAGYVPLTYSKDNHGGYQGAQVTLVTNGVQAYVPGQTYTTDQGNGPIVKYTGTRADPPVDMIPTNA
jgi:ABC-type branched-subunit amino acid transport system substrate-binding protein